MPFPPMEIPLGVAVVQGQPAAGKDWRLAIQLINPAQAPDSPWITLLPGPDDPPLDVEQSQRMIRWTPLWFTATPDSAARSWPVIGRVIAGNRENPVSMDLLYKKGTAPDPGQIAFRWQGKTYRIPPGPDANTCAGEIGVMLSPPAADQARP